MAADLTPESISILCRMTGAQKLRCFQPLRHRAFMRSHRTSLLTLLLVAQVATAVTDATEPDQARLSPIRSVLRREHDVFVSNGVGLFRAELSVQTWTQLPLANGMPVNGYFAKQPSNSKIVFYYVPKWITAMVPEANTQIPGLYASQDSGQSWRLVSKSDDYGPVFLHPNGKLFAVTNGGNLMGTARIHLSNDLGENWRDITGGSTMEIISIFVDPDHPDLVCLVGNSIRGYILQAADEGYAWQETREWEWRRRHNNEKDFFSRFYHTTTTLYELHATLLNYFAHDFGNRAALPAFDIVPQKDAYTFSQAQAKVVQVSVPFLAEPWKKNPNGAWSIQFPGPTIKLLDERDGTGLWGLNVEAPDGKRTRIGSLVSTLVYKSNERAKIQLQLRETGGFRTQDTAPGKPYVRQIDLGKLYDFPIPGTYKVQLIYDSACFENPVHGEWLGGFAGRAFSVTITASQRPGFSNGF